MIDEDSAFEAEDMAKLRKLASELHGGTDRERDYGHRLWLILQRAVPVEDRYREI